MDGNVGVSIHALGGMDAYFYFVVKGSIYDTGWYSVFKTGYTGVL